MIASLASVISIVGQRHCTKLAVANAIWAAEIVHGFFWIQVQKLAYSQNGVRVEVSAFRDYDAEPSQDSANSFRFPLYMRLTVYSFPLVIRTRYSPPEARMNSLTKAALTKVPR